MQEKRSRKVIKVKVEYVPNFKALWNYWFKRKPLPVMKFEVVNNGKEYKDGTDEVFINFDQEGKPKHFNAQIVR